jgi:hypothetical protein
LDGAFFDEIEYISIGHFPPYIEPFIRGEGLIPKNPLTGSRGSFRARLLIGRRGQSLFNSA